VPLVALLLVLSFTSLAAADPADDYRAVHEDWEQDARITPCRWTQAQLENARAIADDNPDDTYNGFPDRVDEEIARRQSGGCDPRARIVGVRAKRERVRLANRGTRPVRVGGMRLRDRQRNTVRLRRGLTIASGDAIVVRSARRPLWDDRGDIARLITKDGTVVSQFGYGRYRNTKRF
jgi:Lamin Tail Domain